MSSGPERVEPDAAGLARAAKVLLSGEVIAFPTDTVYGLAALAGDLEAEGRIYQIKRRPASLPLTTMAATIGALGDLVRIDERARGLAERWWPGPLTLVLPTLSGEPPTLGVRIPDHPAALALLRAVGRPIATTSANLSGAPPAMTADEAARLEGVAVVIDGGRAPGGQASTVLSAAGPDLEVLREGPVPTEALLLPDLQARMRTFAVAEARGLSPLYEAIAAGLAERPDVLGLLLAAPIGQRRPNLLLGAVHLLLLEGVEHRLREWYPDLGGALPPSPNAAEAFAAFALDHAEEVRALVATHRTQTNEVLRTASLALALAQIEGPIALIDAGCSAGLNLRPDRCRIDYGIGQLGDSDAPLHLRCDLRGVGARVPARLPRIEWRAGIDGAPLHPADPATARWLRALVWPEHGARRERLLAALELARREPVPLVQGDVLTELPRVAASRPRGTTLVVQHSALNAYLSAADRRHLPELCAQLGVTEVGLEGSGEGPWARNRLTVDGRTLAEAAPHNEWIDWLAETGTASS